MMLLELGIFKSDVIDTPSITKKTKYFPPAWSNQLNLFFLLESNSITKTCTPVRCKTYQYLPVRTKTYRHGMFQQVLTKFGKWFSPNVQKSGSTLMFRKVTLSYPKILWCRNLTTSHQQNEHNRCFVISIQTTTCHNQLY